jgi:lipopolysaccharide transport system ATP-binding protein
MTMDTTAIQINELGKRFRLGEREPYKTFRESLVKAVRAPLHWRRNGSNRGNGRDADRWLWALRDISLKVEHGEVLGVIGRNGSGKSTLLKILSRITEPTEGYADIQGRVGSLLEVGTGFHKELSGRENIYLNGALLGMRRAEIASKFDQIVAFAEMDRFLDTPVKRYSSGMYMRLAFAVAAHLEPEILLVDEVLAVGDAAFQKKCLGKMSSVAGEGRTVLFVSHNMSAIQNLCPRALWLDSGRVREAGPTGPVVQHYLEAMGSVQTVPLAERSDRVGDGSARMLWLSVEPDDGTGVVRTGSRLRLVIRYAGDKPLLHPRILVSVYDMSHTGIFALDSDMVHGLPERLPAQGSLVCVTDPIHLTPGRCYLNVTLSRGGVVADRVESAAYLDVEADDFYESGKVPERSWVMCVLRHRWEAGE